MGVSGFRRGSRTPAPTDAGLLVRLGPRMRPVSVGLLASLACVGIAESALADPQASIGLTAGAAVQDVVGPVGPGVSVHAGAHADLLLLRDHNGQMALGPYLDVATAGFHDLDTGAGLSWLIPLTPDVPAVLSAGGLVRNGDGRNWAPGLEGKLFVGSRSFNFHSWYGLAAGLFVQTKWVPDSPSTLDLVVGLQIDMELVVLPAMLVWGALTHGS
jgi:hypothetical protein